MARLQWQLQYQPPHLVRHSVFQLRCTADSQLKQFRMQQHTRSTTQDVPFSQFCLACPFPADECDAQFAELMEALPSLGSLDELPTLWRSPLQPLIDYISQFDALVTEDPSATPPLISALARLVKPSLLRLFSGEGWSGTVSSTMAGSSVMLDVFPLHGLLATSLSTAALVSDPSGVRFPVYVLPTVATAVAESDPLLPHGHGSSSASKLLPFSAPFRCSPARSSLTFAYFASVSKSSGLGLFLQSAAVVAATHPLSRFIVYIDESDAGLAAAVSAVIGQADHLAGIVSDNRWHGVRRTMSWSVRCDSCRRFPHSRLPCRSLLCLQRLVSHVSGNVLT